MSTGRSIQKARKLGAAGGMNNAAPLWDYSKRELIEALLHLAAKDTGFYDDALDNGAEGATNRAIAEIEILRRWKLV